MRGGRLRDYVVDGTFPFAAGGSAPTSRIAYAAVHVVADPLADRPTLDWDATLAFRRRIWSYGLGVADAMDTAQRGMGLSWELAAELIRRSAAEAGAVNGRIVCGAQTDQMAPGAARTIGEVQAAYETQCELIEAAGAQVCLMPSRELARIAGSPEDYVRVYSNLLSQLDRPALIHWLGAPFDPALATYWGFSDLDLATEVLLRIVESNRKKVEGVKLSLLDLSREVAIRERLPEGVHMFTGDDFDYPATIRGEAGRHSDALLGAFDAIAPAASAALLALDRGDVDGFDSILEPTVALSRHIFEAPTYHYKTGLGFLAYLNGDQAHFRMLGGVESARSVAHLCQILVLADACGLLRDGDVAAERARRALQVFGVDQS